MTDGTLFEKARAAAQDAFDVDDDTRNADKVCAVGLHTASDSFVAFFSGSVGYKALIARFRQNNASSTNAQAGNAITHTLTAFLKSQAGGSFSDAEIRNAGRADHGRGAMNCAEPKLYYYLRHIRNDDPANWIVIPFNKTDAGLVHNPPCGNCRSWAYGVFHPRTRVINGA